MPPNRFRAEPVVVKFVRSKLHPLGYLVDPDLNLRSVDELRRWAARQRNFVVVDSASGEDITRVLLA